MPLTCGGGGTAPALPPEFPGVDDCELNLGRGSWILLESKQGEWAGSLCLVFSPLPRPPQKPRRLLSRDPEEEQVDREQKGRLQLAMELAAVAMATGFERPRPGARKFKGLVATYPVQPYPSMRSQR